MHTRLKARWVFPVDRPPIENGVIETANGLIVDVRRAKPQEVAEDLGDVAILPGLVNAHAHLEFNLVAKPFEPPLPFTHWIRSLMAYRRETFGAETAVKLAAIAAGWREAANTGTTLVGEIATDSWSAVACVGSGPRVVAFRELIGLRAETIEQQATLAEEWLANPSGNPSIVSALSPHAPYSVSPELLTRAVTLANKHNAPIAMHLAETRAELEFLATGQGEFSEMLRGFGALPAGGLPTGSRLLDLLRALSAAPRALVVHGNYLTDDEIDFIAARSNLSVIYCPRTHEFFGHEPHPWRQMLAKGINVALGTDGRGSNPDLSLWNELVFLRSRFPDVAPQKLLALGTTAGARALSFAHDCGSLTPGKRADMVIVSVTTRGFARDPYEFLLAPDQQVVQTRFGGAM